MGTVVKRSDVELHEQLTRMTDAQLVTAVRAMLGAKLTAYLAGVNETRAVRQWADGDREIGSPAARERLKTAYRAGALIAATDTDRVVQAWFQGLNPTLDDRAPARMLVEADDQDGAGAAVLAAARQFAAVG